MLLYWQLVLAHNNDFWAMMPIFCDVHEFC